MRKPDWWLRFEAKVKSSKVYIACWSRPAGNAPIRTRLSYGVIAFYLLAGAQFLPPLIIEYNTLEEMDKRKVVVLGARYIEGKNGSSAVLKFKEAGEIKEIKIATLEKEVLININSQKGKRAKIWMEYVNRIIDPYYLIWRININGNDVLSYRYPTDESVNEANEDWYKMSVKITFFGLSLSIILFLYVILRLGNHKRR